MAGNHGTKAVVAALLANSSIAVTKLIAFFLTGIGSMLALETKSLLLGEAATPESQERIAAALAATPAIERVIHMKTLHLGLEELLVAAKVGVLSGDSAEQVAVAIDAAGHVAPP